MAIMPVNTDLSIAHMCSSYMPEQMQINEICDRNFYNFTTPNSVFMHVYTACKCQNKYSFAPNMSEASPC